VTPPGHSTRKRNEHRADDLAAALPCRARSAPRRSRSSTSPRCPTASGATDISPSVLCSPVTATTRPNQRCASAPLRHAPRRSHRAAAPPRRACPSVRCCWARAVRARVPSAPARVTSWSRCVAPPAQLQASTPPPRPARHPGTAPGCDSAPRRLVHAVLGHRRSHPASTATDRFPLPLRCSALEARRGRV